MESIDILTGQHVTIAYKPASVFERGLATVLDWFIQGFYIFFIYLLFEQWGIYSNPSDDLSLIIVLILLIPVTFYNFLFEGFINGQTPGKMALKVRVTHMDGSAPSIGSHFLRWLLRIADFFPFLGALGTFFIFFTRRHQRIGDLAAGTVVVRTSDKIDIGAEYYEFDDNYEPVYPQVEKLSEGQVALIRNFLDLPEDGNELRINELANKVKKTLDVEMSESDRGFLVRIVKDYYYYTSIGI